MSVVNVRLKVVLWQRICRYFVNIEIKLLLKERYKR